MCVCVCVCVCVCLCAVCIVRVGKLVSGWMGLSTDTCCMYPTVGAVHEAGG